MTDAINPLTGKPVGTLPLNEVASMPGLTFFQEAIAGNIPMPPIAAVMPMAPVEAELGRIVFRARPESRFYNPIGSIHGGYAATLLDTALGCAVHTTLEAGEGYTTLEIKVVYHRPITHKSGDLRIEGTVISRGSRVAASEAKLTDEAGNLLASGTTTCLIFPVPAG